MRVGAAAVSGTTAACWSQVPVSHPVVVFSLPPLYSGALGQCVLARCVDSSRQLFSHCCEDSIWSSFFHIACRRQNAKAFFVTVNSGLRFLKEFEEIIN